VSSTQAERTAALDDRLEKLRANMKAGRQRHRDLHHAGEVFAGASTVLQDCASGSDHYFGVTNSAQLDLVFQQIAGSITALRLSK
jgi:hypothetical protein